MKCLIPRLREGGVTLLEVMITIAILAIGLLGLAGLQARAHLAESESYARGQAILLVREMSDRILANLVEADEGKKVAQSGYNVSLGGVTGLASTAIASPREFGFGVTAPTCALAGSAQVACKDLLAWHQSLNSVAATGGLRTARGCVFRELDATTNLQQYVVTVAWAGQGSFGAAPPADRICGSIDITKNRRVVSLVVPIADLGGI